jgi:3-isopropylmalate/(R)-2-methylmalate dehydratase small subunit
MESFTTLTSVGIPIDMVNVDTDQIIPVRFLPRQRTDPEYHTFLFHDLRFDKDGKEKPDFVMNRQPYRGGQIIVADENWGCGSSREGAVWTLVANNIRAVIAPSFGDIHHNNAMKNGMLPIRLTKQECAELRAQLNKTPGAKITIDLDAQSVTGPDGKCYSFDIDPFQKYRMLNGLDDIDVTMEYENEFEAFEKRYKQEATWLYAD